MKSLLSVAVTICGLLIASAMNSTLAQETPPRSNESAGESLADPSGSWANGGGPPIEITLKGESVTLRFASGGTYAGRIEARDHDSVKFYIAIDPRMGAHGEYHTQTFPSLTVEHLTLDPLVFADDRYRQTFCHIGTGYKPPPGPVVLPEFRAEYPTPAPVQPEPDTFSPDVKRDFEPSCIRRLVYARTPAPAKIQLLAQTAEGPVKVSRLFHGVPTMIEAVFEDPRPNLTVDVIITIEGKDLKVTAKRDPLDYRRFVTDNLVPTGAGTTAAVSR